MSPLPLTPTDQRFYPVQVKEIRIYSPIMC